MAHGQAPLCIHLSLLCGLPWLLEIFKSSQVHSALMIGWLPWEDFCSQKRLLSPCSEASREEKWSVSPLLLIVSMSMSVSRPCCGSLPLLQKSTDPEAAHHFIVASCLRLDVDIFCMPISSWPNRCPPVQGSWAWSPMLGHFLDPAATKASVYGWLFPPGWWR